MSDYCIGMTTFASADQAAPIVRRIIEEKLAACAQVIEISSTYVWEGDVEDASEVLVLFKTRADRFPVLVERMAELHPYETPELISIPVMSGLAGYLRWVDEQTAG